MGDVILVSPLLTYLRQHIPGARLCLLTGRYYRGLYEDDTRLESLRTAERGELNEVCEQLAQEQWDLVVDLQNSRRSRRLTRRYFSGCTVRAFNKLHVQRYLLLLLRLDTYQSDSHVVRRYIQAAGFDPGPVEQLPPLTLSFKECAHLFDRKPWSSSRIQRPAIALFPFSAWPNKQWPRKRFAAVGRYYQDKGWNVFVLGGPEDRLQGEKLAARIGGNAWNFAGALSLHDCGCLLRQCTLALGNDTGLSHLARACGVRTGMIFGATTSHFGFFPYGTPPSTVFEAPLSCRPCHPHGGTTCWRLGRPCLRRITPESVIRGLEDLYHSHALS